MGGERRRRRLRRTGRSAAAESTPESRVAGDLDDAPDPDTGESGDAPDREAAVFEAQAGQRDPAASDAGPATHEITAPTPVQGPPVAGPPVTAPPVAGPPGQGRAAPPTAERAVEPPSGEPPDGEQRSGRRGPRGRGSRPGPPGAQHRPSPADLADLAGPFALTAGVHDPEPPVDQHVQHGDDPNGERGLRGLVGGGSSQVNVAAAMRARDASRPGDEHLAAAEADLPIVRRGWVPRDELPRAGH